jgi:allantoicase
LKLGIVGQIVGVDINTQFFTGNHPPFASLEAVYCDQDATLEQLKEMVSKN